MSPRLSARTLPAALARAGADVTGPAVNPGDLRTGLVHLGLGAFHRAHQAVFTEDAAAATSDDRWGILGVTQRSARVVEQLAPQDGLYGVLRTGPGHSTLRLVGSLRGAVFPGHDTERVLAAVAAPGTHVVTLTVTEKGYRRTPDGHADLTDPDLAADLAALGAEVARPGAFPAAGTSAAAPARSPVGLLVRALARRAAADAGPLTVVSCDNLVDNGAVLRTLVADVLRGLDDAPGRRGRRVADWVEASVRFPGTMVDRIVPATTAAHHTRAEELLGLRDDGLVVAEPFGQWVVEDDFAGPRPAWERAGATLTHDVGPYEQAKLRVLNAAHSAAAYLGALRGHTTIAAATADPEVLAVLRAMLDDDVLPTLTPPDGADLVAYRDQVLARFADPGTGHTTVQVAMDGSLKLPQRLLGTVRDRLAAGAVPEGAAAVVAAWMTFVRAVSGEGLTVAGAPVPLDDPLAATLAAAAAGPLDGFADRMLGVRAVFGDLADSAPWRTAVRAALRDLPLPSVARG
ncbi:mannitol dehydrogenase family protein [Cellulomonas hominis]